MATLNDGQEFDSESAPDAPRYDPVPAQRYLACIMDSAMKPTRNNDGEYLELQFEIMEGEYTGRKLWARLNLKNKSANSVIFAKAELASICRACGVPKPINSEELHLKPLVVEVGIYRNKDTGKLQNEIAGYHSRAAHAAEMAANRANPNAPKPGPAIGIPNSESVANGGAAAVGAKPPWER